MCRQHPALLPEAAVTLAEQIKTPIYGKSELTSLVQPCTGTFLLAGATDGFSVESSEQKVAQPGNLQAQPKVCPPTWSRNECAK